MTPLSATISAIITVALSTLLILSKMDLVTREEFDVQTAVLARTREKLESLEARLAELEADPSN